MAYSQHIIIDFQSLPSSHLQPKLSILRSLGHENSQFEIDAANFNPSLLLVTKIYLMDLNELYFFDYQDISSLQDSSIEISPKNELKTLIQLARINNIFDIPFFASEVDKYYKKIPQSPKGQKLNDSQSLALMQWAQDFNVEHCIELANFEGTGRGMALARPIEAQKVLIKCDASLFISIFSALESPVLGHIFNQLTEIDNDSKLMLFVIYEKFVNPASKWKAYLDLLPSHFDSALYFTEEDLQYLEGTTLGMEIQMTQEQLKSTFDELFPKLSETFPSVFISSAFTWENYKWTRAIFDSRGFNLPLRGIDHNCLLPFIDSINTQHYSHLQARGTVLNPMEPNGNGLGTYVLSTITPINDIGREVYLNYGGFSTRELLMFYGFVFEDESDGGNPYDLYLLNLELPEDEHLEQKMKLAEALGISSEHFLRRKSVSINLILYFSIVLLSPLRLKKLTSLLNSNNNNAETIRKLLLIEPLLQASKNALIDLIQSLLDSLLSSNQFLSLKDQNSISFTSNRSKLAFQYSKSQLAILESSLEMAKLISIPLK